MNYNVTHKIKDGKYVISVFVSIPNLVITTTLNFRIRKNILYNGETVFDPHLSGSKHCFEITKSMLGRKTTFDFIFNAAEISNVDYITLGFCDENIRWYDNTFINIKSNQLLINSLNKESFNKVCILSTWEIKCGIAQYCKNFYDALIEKNCSVKIFPHTSEYIDVFGFIKNNDYNVFIVQYEPALIKNFAELLENIKSIKRQNRKVKVFFVIHSENIDLLSLDGIIDGFIYHKKNTLLFRKTKVNIIPMAVPVFDPKESAESYRSKYNIPSNSFVISTVGFMFGWKQHANVLAALVPMLKANDNIVVQLFTSFHSINNGECIEEYNKIQAVISENDIVSQVIHITDYIPQAELNERLYLSNLGFLWAAIETTSSSASLKEFVSSRLPVVRTNSTHYHDIIGGCEVVGQNMDLFASTIDALSTNQKRLALLKSQMTSNYGIMNYNNVISKFTRIFDA